MSKPTEPEMQDVTQETFEAYMEQPATVGCLFALCKELTDQQIMPSVDGKFAFLVDFMRYVLAAAGVMRSEDFNQVYAEYADAFRAATPASDQAVGADTEDC